MSEAMKQLRFRAALPEIEEIAAQVLLTVEGCHYETAVVALMRVTAALISDASDREGREALLDAVIAALRHRVRTLGT